MDFSKHEKFLVLRAQTGDLEAFDELLKIIQAPLFGYICRLTGGNDLAEDILQEVFLIIYRKLRWLENAEVFRAWSYRIASREAFRRLKQEKKWSEQIRDEEILATISTDEVVEIYEPELMEKLPALLAEISPASRALIILHYLEEMSLSETAEILDIGLGTAKSRLAYGLQSLRKKIGRENL